MAGHVRRRRADPAEDHADADVHGEGHGFGFNEAISLQVHCATRQEIGYYWDKLSADPNAEQCGWLKDNFGLSWQVVPDELDAMLATNDQEEIARVTEAFLQMKKFDLAKLREAAEGVGA